MKAESFVCFTYCNYICEKLTVVYATTVVVMKQVQILIKFVSDILDLRGITIKIKKSKVHN